MKSLKYMYELGATSYDYKLLNMSEIVDFHLTLRKDKL